MKISLSFKFLFIVLLLSQNIKQSHQQLPDGDDVPKNYHQLDLPQVTGPESIAFDCKNQGPYVGVSDGRILKWHGPHLGWKEFAIPSPVRDRKLCDGSTNPNLEPICGRPLGLKFNYATCDLYIADAYFGLLVVGPNGGVAQQLATSAEGVPFRFTNGLDIDSKTGKVYFTDSSIFFQRRYHLLLRITSDRSGRLLKYDPRTKDVTVMYRGLMFPNGVALNADNSYLLVAESTTMRILKFRLEGEANSYIPELFIQLSRTPDNIQRNKNGEFWVGLNSGRSGRIQDDAYAKLPDPVGVKLNQEGKILKQLDGNGGITFNSISEVQELNGTLYIGSVTKPYLGILYP
ncbi:Strictosidine synthase [Theobroma cacao]|nr:Strictosidine synthase [Theobroma cacao]